MIQEGVGHAEIAFGVFEVDRVHLVRHRGGTDFTGLQLLVEVAERDIAPDVTVHIDQDRVRAGDFLEEFSHVVVRLDLDRVRIEAEVQAVFDHVPGESFPVLLGVGNDVCVEIADSAVHLGEDLNVRDGVHHALQTHGEDSEFLTDCRRGSVLAMGTGEHRNFSPLVSKAGDRVVKLLQEVEEFLATFSQHERVARVIDVLGRAGEVHKFGSLGELGVVSHLSLDPVFDRLHVVIGGLFDVLDLLAAFNREVRHEAAQESLAVLGNFAEFRQTEFRKGDEPFRFNLNTGLHEGVFREDFTQRVSLPGITSVEGAEGCKRGKIHFDMIQN